tara:strand:+ start:43 stop:930 length:888 start_codon:yes stop_codon:yes gene_type:complete
MSSIISYDDVIKSVKEHLPSLPKILHELVSKLSDPDTNLDKVEELVMIDKSITAQILKVSNKLEFLEPHEPRIVTIHDALHKIGFENAKRIALNFSVLKIMKITNFPRNFCCEDLWQHSLGVAVASSLISELVDFENPDQAYACGLIHDIGKLVKLNYSYRMFSKEIASASRKKIDLYDLEIRRDLLRHDILGSKIMDAWEMPNILSCVVRWHHTEERSERKEIEDPYLHQLVDVVYLANLLINKLGIGYSGHSVAKNPSEKFLRSMNLDLESLNDLESSIKKAYEESCPVLLII